jgi:hypothetical protein
MITPEAIAVVGRSGRGNSFLKNINWFSSSKYRQNFNQRF